MIRVTQTLAFMLAGILALNALEGWQAGVFPTPATATVEAISGVIAAAAYMLGRLHQEGPP